MKKLLLILCLWSLWLARASVPASAVSAQVVIYQVQSGGSGSGTASEELLVIRNLASTPVNVTDWCVQYSAATNGNDFTILGCSKTEQPNVELWLEAGGLMSFASDQFTLKNAGFSADFTLSAGMAAAGGHVRLVDGSGNEVDRLGWGTALRPEGSPSVAALSGQALTRKLQTVPSDTDNNANDFMSAAVVSPIVSGVYEAEIVVDVCSDIEGVQATIPEGYLLDDDGACFKDACLNVDGLQVSIPTGYQTPADGSICEVVLLSDRPLLITEILPNVAGYDDGLEFIEIYNPNPDSVALSGYTLQLGLSGAQSYSFDQGSILPGQYMAFSDAETGITLPNTSASVRLIAPAGNIVSETDMYNNPSENVAWALLEDQWIFTNQVTKSDINKPYLEAATDEVLGVTTVLAPCPAGKFRNPATNRCKSIEVIAGSLAECKKNEYRNENTNRCKSLSTSTSSLIACKEGQTRNPDTNRCKSISSSSGNLVPCDPGEERNPQTNRCKKKTDNGLDANGLSQVKDVATKESRVPVNFLLIGALIACAAAYVGYEWRAEIRQSAVRMMARFGLGAKRKPAYERFL